MEGGGLGLVASLALEGGLELARDLGLGMGVGLGLVAGLALEVGLELELDLGLGGWE